MNLINVEENTSRKIKSIKYLKYTISALFSVQMVLSSSIATAHETLDYLKSIQGKYTIGAMHNKQPNSDPNKYSRELQSITGKWPGLYSSDFQFEPQEIAHRQTVVDQALREWSNGAMINLMWHACNPAKHSPCQWNSEGVLSSMTDWQWNQLITDGTTINKEWKSRMDEVAIYLQQLKEAGVEVMFRPLHEMNQGMFWWGGRPGKDGTARLYQITHDYFLYEKELTNLVWLWNLQDFSTLESDLQDYDPGNEYWDVLTLDMYWSDGTGYTKAKYNAMKNKAAGKPIAIGECADLPATNLLAEQPLWTSVMPWSELGFSTNSDSVMKSVYQSDRVITREEMPGWHGYQFPNKVNIPMVYVQAQNYDAQSGVSKVVTTDIGGNKILTSINSYDWMAYKNIEIKKSGNYSFAFRVASAAGGQLQIEKAGTNTVYAVKDIPATGSNNTWKTVYKQVYLTAGTHYLAIKANQGGWKFNWFSYTFMD